MADPLYVLTDAIDADGTLSASEKSRQKANLKAAGIVSALLAAWTFPKTFAFSKSGHAYSVTITSVSVRTVIAAGDGLSRDLLSIAGSATRDGVRLKNADGSHLFPIEFANPPCLIAGGGTVVRNGQTFTYDLATMAQSLVSDQASTNVTG